jgi:hypothetical protein
LFPDTDLVQHQRRARQVQDHAKRAVIRIQPPSSKEAVELELGMQSRLELDQLRPPHQDRLRIQAVYPM